MVPSPARRSHRPLLFPPGLLALGFLLLLGCQALRPWHALLEKKSVLALTLPPKPTSDFIYPVIFIKDLEGNRIKTSYNAREGLHRYSQLAHFRPWQDFAFTGVPAQDAATARAAQHALRAMQADTLHAKGIRVRFGAHSTYASLIRMLDLPSVTERQVLDLHHEPATFYAFTNAYKPSTGIVVDLRNDVLYPKPPPATARVQPLTWPEAFSSSAWRNSIYLLLGILAVSSWKMARRWHTA